MRTIRGSVRLTFLTVATLSLLPGACATPGPAKDDTAADTDTELRWVDVSANGDSTCGVRSDGKLHCWGSDAGKVVSDAPGSGVWLEVDVGATNFACARDADHVECWGDDSAGAGATSPPALEFRSLDLGYFTGCGITADGHVDCWGSYACGESEYGCAYDDHSDGTHASVSAGMYTTCAVAADGDASCWGFAAGDESNPSLAILSDIPDLALEKVSVPDSAQYFACGLATNGAISCWGMDEPSISGSFVDVATNTNYVCGILENGTPSCAAMGGETNPATVADVSEPLVSISAGNQHACGISLGGDIVCWGANESGQRSVPTVSSF